MSTPSNTITADNYSSGSETASPTSSWPLWEIFSKAIMASALAYFLAINGKQITECFRLSTLIVMIKLALDTYFILIRRFASDISRSPFDWVVAISGTYSVIFLTAVNGEDNFVFQIVQFTGFLLQVAAICSLNRSFGIVAANRGIKTGGMYQVVRHPLYGAYVISYLGFVLNHFTTTNIIVYAVFFVLMFMRTIAEERLLLRSETYQAYARRVRWRIIPFVL